MRGPVLVYDGECRVCRLAARAYAAWDREARVSVVPFGHPLADAVLARIPVAERATALRFAWDGPVRSARDAVRGALRRVPGGWVALALRADALYPHVVARRGRIGRLVPDVAPVARLGAGARPGS